MEKKAPNPYRENLLWILFAIIAGFVTEAVVIVIGRTVPLSELVRNVLSYINIIRIIFFEVLYLGALAVIYTCNRKGIDWLDLIYRKRYLIAVVILILCMIFQINGSSIGCIDKVTGYNLDNGVLAGISRPIRSDEWAVSTPMAFAQKANDYKYFNSNIRGGYNSDMFIVYGQPVKDISIIFRLFHIGYILFGSSVGLSFYWCARFLALFLASFEFLMLITNKKKFLSFVGATMIVFSPTIQWWYATNSLMEMIISAEVGLVFFDKYLKTNNFKLKTIYMSVIAICVGTFILTFYPAWMIPIAYIFVPFLIWIIIENRKNIKITKKDIVAFLVIGIVFAGLMARILIKSWDTILATLNTVYPGKRIVLEKGSLKVYIGFIVNSLLTILTSVDNPCDMTVMMDLWPVVLILLAVYVIKEKKKDILITMCLVVALILNAYYIFAMPEWLAKITLFSRTWYGRVYQVFGLLNIFMLFRILANTEFEFKNKWALVISAILSIVCVLISKHYYPLIITKVIAVVLVLAFTLIFYSVLMANQKKKLFFTVIIVFMVLIGGLVNPVRSGISAVEDNTLLQQIENIDNQEKGMWALIEIGLPEINMPMMVGAKTLNSTSVYPNIDLWSKIDEKHQFEDIYNRYAHIFITLVDNTEETQFELLAPDVIRIFMTYDDIKTLGVNYIVRSARFEPYDITNEEFKLDELYKDENYVIYKIIY